jgi:hypothetical protein
MGSPSIHYTITRIIIYINYYFISSFTSDYFIYYMYEYILKINLDYATLKISCFFLKILI